MYTSTVTGEKSTQYIPSLLETTKSVIVDTIPNAHTDPAYTDPVLLGKRTITPKDHFKVKKKKSMDLVMFKKDQRFWTIDEAEEDVDKKENHVGFPVCTNAACSNACSDVMPSFLDVTKRSLSMSMSLSDLTKPRMDKRKSDIHTNKLSVTTFRDQY